MILKIIDKDLREYEFNNFIDSLYTYNFFEFPQPLVSDCRLTISNTEELPLDEKKELYNLFTQLKQINIKDIIIESSKPIQITSKKSSLNEIEFFSKLFDNNEYNLLFVDIEYSTEYNFIRNSTPENENLRYEQIKITFYLNKEK